MNEYIKEKSTIYRLMKKENQFLDGFLTDSEKLETTSG